MTTYGPPICLDCKHFVDRGPGLTCAAFLDGIPEEILMSIADHHEPYKGDRGIQFEPKDDEESTT